VTKHFVGEPDSARVCSGLLIGFGCVVMLGMGLDSLDSFVETWLIELYCFGQRGVVN
jgi:hypothetical protein